MSLREDMRLHLLEHEGASPIELARSFLAEHDKDELVPLLAEEFAHRLRERTRYAETVLGSRARVSRHLTLAATRRVLSELETILGARYAVGDGRPRAGREMTVEDWQTRRVMLVGQIAGIQHAVNVCDRAVELIHAYGVRTLGEIEAVSEATAA